MAGVCPHDRVQGLLDDMTPPPPAGVFNRGSHHCFCESMSVTSFLLLKKCLARNAYPPASATSLALSTCSQSGSPG